MLENCIDAMIEGALAQVAEPLAATAIEIKPGYVETALTTLLRKIGSSFAAQDPRPVDLRLRRLGPHQSSTVFCRCEPPRVGVFPLAANPIHWGHIIGSLAAVALPAGNRLAAAVPTGHHRHAGTWAVSLPKL